MRFSFYLANQLYIIYIYIDIYMYKGLHSFACKHRWMYVCGCERSVYINTLYMDGGMY